MAEQHKAQWTPPLNSRDALSFETGGQANTVMPDGSLGYSRKHLTMEIVETGETEFRIKNTMWYDSEQHAPTRYHEHTEHFRSFETRDEARAALAENKTDFLRAAADDHEDRLEHQREAERGERSFDPDAAYEAHLDRLTGVDHGERAEARGDRVRAEIQAMTGVPTHESLPDLAATDTGDPLGIHRARSDELER